MDPVLCCFLGICCPPDARLERVAGYLSAHTDRESAYRIAEYLIGLIDASPIGKLVQAVTHEAREHRP